ncbi:MAG TPA: DUF1552 domain-containing protein [Polyangiaceae bacterium]|nr:DUF1552 domain-containing protein [Polyangiaceae bacterium]
MSRPKVFKRHVVNRRAFLYGAGGIAIGLPFLEGLPERSAWAADAEPIFTFFMCAACGVEPKRFWPSGFGDLATVLASGDKAVNELKAHAANLLIIKNIDFPQSGPSGCGHAEGLCQALTGTAPASNGSRATAKGPSVDVVISKAVNAAGTDPLTLYAGNLNNGFIEERLSFDTSGKVRAATDSPYKLYQSLMGVAAPAGSGGGMTGTGGTGSTPPPPTMTDWLLSRRKSANDQVRAELNTLMANKKLSAADVQRLKQHFDAIREVEVTMMDPTSPSAMYGCSLDGLDTAGLEAVKSYRYQKQNVAVGGMENIVQLHMQLVALAFACNYNRTATLQWGDGTDATIYDVPSNKSLSNWGLHYISHRTASDGALGTNATAEAAHAEIDVLRMQTVAAGLNHFRDRGLADKAVVLWTNHVAEGNHTMRSVPQIIWGSGGGYFKQGQYIDGAKAQNGKLHNMIITAATGNASPNFGSSGGGEIAAAKA